VVLKVTYPLWEDEKKVRAIAKRCGPFVSTYRGMRGLRDYYDKGWVGLVWADDEPVGFWVIRQGIRNKWTTIHEIGVVPEAQRRGYGEQMINFLLSSSPYWCLRLVCDARNEGGLAFYRRMGFKRLHTRFNKAGDTIVDLVLSA
jgi:ribosomal protein S18 acetylase RimI-like enzyme